MGLDSPNPESGLCSKAGLLTTRYAIKRSENKGSVKFYHETG
jgi:hypothetical protein